MFLSYNPWNHQKISVFYDFREYKLGVLGRNGLKSKDISIKQNSKQKTYVTNMLPTCYRHISAHVNINVISVWS